MVHKAATIILVSITILSSVPEITEASFIGIGNSSPFVWVRSLPSSSDIAKKAASVAQSKKHQVGGWLGQLLGAGNQTPTTSSPAPSTAPRNATTTTHAPKSTKPSPPASHGATAANSSTKLANISIFASDLTHHPRLSHVEDIIKRKKARAVRFFARGAKKHHSTTSAASTTTTSHGKPATMKPIILEAGPAYSFLEVTGHKSQTTSRSPTVTKTQHHAKSTTAKKRSHEINHLDLLPPIDRKSLIYDLAAIQKSLQKRMKKHKIFKRDPNFNARNRYALVDVATSQEDEVAEKSSASGEVFTKPFNVDLNATVMNLQSTEEANKLIRELERLRDLVILRKIVQYMIREKKRIVSNRLVSPKYKIANEGKQVVAVDTSPTVVVYHPHTEAPDNTERNKRALQADLVSPTPTTKKPKKPSTTSPNSTTKPPTTTMKKLTTTTSKSPPKQSMAPMPPAAQQAGPAYEIDGTKNTELVELNHVKPIMPSYRLASELKVATEVKKLGETEKRWKHKERLSRIYNNLLELTKHVVKSKPEVWKEQVITLPDGSNGGEHRRELKTKEATSMLDSVRQENALKTLKELKNLKMFDEQVLNAV